MTAPRRVPTEVERTAGHVHLGPLATVIARLGVALGESRREVQRLHADNDRLRQQVKATRQPDPGGMTWYCGVLQPTPPRRMKPYRCTEPASHAGDHRAVVDGELAAEWHRLTRRNP